MKQRTNVFIMIGVIVFACGQIQVSQAMGDVVQSREQNIEELNRKIFVERNKTYGEHNRVDFYKIFLEGEKLERQLLRDYEKGSISEINHDNLSSTLEEAKKLLADGVLANSIKLTFPIIGHIKDIQDNIEQLQKSDNFFSFDANTIMNTINTEINPRLDSARQGGLL